MFSWMISRSCRFPRRSASSGGGSGARDSGHLSSRMVVLLRVARIIVGMTVNEILARLESLGDDARRAHNTKAGAPDNQFGVKLGDIRAMAKKIKTDHELALNLWDTGNVEAQLLAMLIIKPKSLSADELDKLTRSTTCAGGRLAERLCRRTTSREGRAA